MVLAGSRVLVRRSKCRGESLLLCGGSSRESGQEQLSAGRAEHGDSPGSYLD